MALIHYDLSHLTWQHEDRKTWPIAQSDVERDYEPQHWRIRSADELGQVAPIEWLIYPWLAAKQVSAIVGPGGSFKSFISQTWALQLAAEGRIAVYLSAEGETGLRGRVAAWQDRHEIPTLPTFLAIEDPVPLHEPATVNEWIQVVMGELEERLAGRTPDLVVADTLARNFVGGDENSARDMSQLVDGCETIKRELDTAVHCPTTPRLARTGGHEEPALSSMRRSRCSSPKMRRTSPAIGR